MRPLVVALVGLTWLAAPALAERPRIYAITGASVVTSPGRVVEQGTVVIRDGLIEAVGPGLAAPADAEVIDAAGGWVYPGLIDLHSRLDVLPTGGRESRGRTGASTGPGGPGTAAAGPVHPLSRIRPEKRASDTLVPFPEDRKRELQRMRSLGITTVLAAPQQGILRGRSVAIQIVEGRPVAELILRDDVAQHASFERGRFGGGYPSSLMGAVAAIRQTLLDAQRHEVWNERWQSDPQGLPRPEFHAAFAALASVVSGRQPLFVEVDNPDDALLAHRVGSEFGLETVIDASGHEWEMAQQIAATGRSLLLPIASPDKPKVGDEDEALAVTRRTMQRYLEASSGPARLHSAGVHFALTTRGLKSTTDFRKNMRKIIDAGLPEELALAAWTSVPAKLIGLDRALGSIEPGKIANLVVADGPIFDKDTQVSHVFVDGTDYEVEKPAKPKGDPDAVVDPRGSWSVVMEMGSRSFERTWTIDGEPDQYTGTAETQAGTVTFEKIELAGNAMTVLFPPRGGRGSMEVTVVISGEEFEGLAEMGPRSMEISGTRTSGPEEAP